MGPGGRGRRRQSSSSRVSLRVVDASRDPADQVAAGGGATGGVPRDSTAWTTPGASDDGWNGPGANMATGPAPACNEAPPVVRRTGSDPHHVRDLRGCGRCHRGSLGILPRQHERLLPRPTSSARSTRRMARTTSSWRARTASSVRNPDPRTVGTWEVKLADRGVLEVHTYGNRHPAIGRPVGLSARARRNRPRSAGALVATMLPGAMPGQPTVAPIVREEGELLLVSHGARLADVCVKCAPRRGDPPAIRADAPTGPSGPPSGWH